MKFVVLKKEVDGLEEVTVNPKHVLTAEQYGRGTRVQVSEKIQKLLELTSPYLFSSFELFLFTARLNRR
jgi:hypothetical protein